MSDSSYEKQSLSQDSAPVLQPLRRTANPFGETTNNKEPQGQIAAFELRELREDYLRLAADFDNFKKRTVRENEHRARELKDGFIRELLPVIDNLERAMAAVPSASSAALHEGVKLTLHQLVHLLSLHGLEPEHPLGHPFDPHYHDAACIRKDPRYPNHTVVEVWHRGWRRACECFRPAKVVVNDHAANLHSR